MDIENFEPFKAEVWGNVTSWLRLIVSTLWVVFAVRSFHGQGDINEQQKEPYRLAVEKDRREIMPSFRFREMERIIVEDETIIQGEPFVSNNKAMSIMLYASMLVQLTYLIRL